MIKKNFSNYVLLFFTYSIIGWIFEVLIAYFYFNIGFVNKGFLYGPCLPIYGIITLLIISIFFNYKNKKIKFGKINLTPIILFLKIQILVCSIEYVTSYFFEKIFNKRWWNYKFPYNINGRICLYAALIFGILGLIVLYILNPILMKWFNKISDFFKHYLSLLLITIFIVDLIFSITNHLNI